MDGGMNDKPELMLVSPTTYQAYWREFARLGPRHANVKRWLVDCGWTAEPSVFDVYLAPERPKEALYG
jgi:hypothetical protein